MLRYYDGHFDDLSFLLMLKNPTQQIALWTVCGSPLFFFTFSPASFSDKPLDNHDVIEELDVSKMKQ